MGKKIRRDPYCDAVEFVEFSPEKSTPENPIVLIMCQKCNNRWPRYYLTIKEIDSEIAKAKKFRPELNEFILLTTAPNDVTVQDHVAALNKSKSSGIGFRVEVYS